MRWAAVEAVQRVSGHTRLGQTRDRIGECRGRNIGVVAAARELITLVFYGMRVTTSAAFPAPPALVLDQGGHGDEEMVHPWR